MVLIKCNPEYDPQVQLNTFVHVHYQSYIATAITQMVICPTRIKKYNNK